MISRLRKLSRYLLSKSPSGLKVLLRMGKLSKGDYDDIMSEFVMRAVLNADSNCVDIGCHLGDVLEPMLRFAPNGMCFAFEPLPKLFEHLQSRFGTDGRVKLFNLALSDIDGSEIFQHVVDAPAYSGFRSTEAGREKGTVQTLNVKTARLDEILEGVHVDLVKIDVEGAEFQVLRGGLETIRRCKPYVLFEHQEHAANYGTKPEDIFDLLNEQCGLRISLLDGFLRGRRALLKSEFTQLGNSEIYFVAHGR
jgi:FkbM family methyltransferase